MEFEAKKMRDRQNPPRCILCGDPVKKGQLYHTLQHKGTKYFHADCYKKEFGRRD